MEATVTSLARVRGLVVWALLIGIVGVGAGGPRHVSADTNQEWAAVQKVVGSDIDPQAFLYPVMNAIGTQAIQDGAILQIPAGQFLSPAWMVAAVQRMIRRLDVGD